MAKDVNIHVKTPGTEQAKSQLNGVAQSTEKIGESTERMGQKTSKAFDWLTSGIRSLIGPLGFAAIVTSVAGVTMKVAKFFDEIKQKSDEAVRNLESVRKGFESIYEVMGAFDEKSRQQITKETYQLFYKTATPESTGLPIMSEYYRQFGTMTKTGQLSQADYNKGLEQMLRYGSRHPGVGGEMATLMAGWNMNTPQQQGQFQRMVSAGAEMGRIDEADMISVLSRTSSTARAMGWSPQETISMAAKLAAGETGRRRLMVPAATIEALGNPQAPDAELFGITDKKQKADFDTKWKTMVEDPRKVYAEVQAMQQRTPPQKFLRILRGIYGSSGTDVLKTLGGDAAGIQTLAEAAGPAGEAAAAKEDAARMGTTEAMEAQTGAAVKLNEIDRAPDAVIKENIRKRGASYLKQIEEKHPVGQWLAERGPALLFRKNQAKLEEEAAMYQWLNNLHENQGIDVQHRSMELEEGWQSMTPKQRLAALDKTSAPSKGSSVTIHNHNETIYQPKAGPDNTGARFSQD